MTEKTVATATNRSICTSGGVIATATATSTLLSQSSPSSSMLMSSSTTSSSNVAAATITSTPTTTSTNNGNNGSNSSGNGANGSGNGNGSGSIIDHDSSDNQHHNHHHISNSIIDRNSIMNSSVISTASNDSLTVLKGKHGGHGHVNAHVAGKSSCRFPKLEDCAHFHYERVQLGPLKVRLIVDQSELLNNSIASQSIGGDVASTSANPSTSRHFSPNSCWFFIKVFPNNSDPFLIKRSFENVQFLDEMLHQCVYDRKISGLKDISRSDFRSEDEADYMVAEYLERFSKIASDSLTCGTVLTWFQLDNKGRRLPLADSDTQRCINTPAVGAAYGVRKYNAQAPDEISIEVGDMISVIDMPSPAESVWWRGKKSHLQKSHYEVGFFPQSCVATIGDKVPRNFPLPAPLAGQLDVSPTKPVLRKHGKLIAFFRSFILSRPSRRRLKQSGIYRERVFSCDLSEHLLNSEQEIPMVLKCCAEFLEESGIVDGIYRLSGITSTIQKLRRAFDEERIPDLTTPEIRQDIHAVSSLLKMYFRELPNPLCTYQLYDNFVEAIQAKSESEERLRLMKQTVLKLPPPHYRTLKYLANHLNKISQHAERTGMTDKNLAIVWAPNLLRSPALESGGVAALQGVGVQAVVTEYLIKNCRLIFDSVDDIMRNSFANAEHRMDSLTDCESLLIEQREHDQSLTFTERPKSLSAAGPKLISLEEAQERHSRLDSFDLNKAIPIPPSNPNIGSYIEVGGGPSSLPDKYHTVLPVPRTWQKRKNNSWKSLFTRNPRSSNSNHDIKQLNISISSPVPKDPPLSVTFATDIDSHHPENEPKILEKPNSIDLGDARPMEICVRSNSIDSLRTATGHSRSVSHDSYFDLLQSPLRTTISTTCPSRELSELGINFDREEPDLRIFSESESLVSSPRVGKENVPPRRVLRARPEEYSSTNNSVNPSPKKQPRLNLLSPNDQHSWSPVAGGENNCTEHSDESSCCKRYKLEDQLSDIQYIDCSTPEHVISNANPVYATPSKDKDKDKKKNVATFESIFENKDKKEGSSHIITRYSYPTVTLGAKRKENESPLKERFSYPTTGAAGKYVCRMIAKDVQMNTLNEEAKKNEEIENEEEVQQPIQPLRVTFQQQAQPAKMNFKLLENLKPRHRYSYCEPAAVDTIVTGANRKLLMLRSNSEDLACKNNEIEQSHLSVVTPSSPANSPRYSLLTGETSSNVSSTLNTPIFEMDPLGSICSSQHEGDILEEEADNEEDRDDVLDELNEIDEEEEEDKMCNSDVKSSPSEPTKRDISAIKRELSLNLDGVAISSAVGLSTKMAVDLTDISPASASLILNKQTKTQLNVPQIQSPSNSIFTTTSAEDEMTSQSVTPSEFGYQHLNRQSNVISSLENSPNSYENLEVAFLNETRKLIPPPSPKIKSTISIIYKSPTKEQPPTSVDDEENPRKPLLETVFDENMIYEQVKIFRNAVNEVNELIRKEDQIVPDLKMDISPKETNSNLIDLSSDNDIPSSDDIHMSDNNDSLEGDEHTCSLYENVELRKPSNDYEEIDVNGEKDARKADREKKVFSVRQLATKFEISPSAEQKPQNQKIKQLDRSAQITRSLDENAFVREFGSVKKIDDFTKSVQTISRPIDDDRKAKTLNLPKKIPGQVNLQKVEESASLDVKITPTNENPISLIQNNAISGVQLNRDRIERIKEERRNQMSEKYRSESFKTRSKTDLTKDENQQKFVSESLRVKSKSRTDVRSFSRDNDNLKTTETLQFSNRVRSISDEKNQNNCDGIEMNGTLTGTESNQNQKKDDYKNVHLKFERKSLDFPVRERNAEVITRHSVSSNREKISPQYSIRDMTAMFESRSQSNQ